MCQHRTPLTSEQLLAARQDPKLANVLYHDWEATSYDDKWSISYDQRCIDYAVGRFRAVTDDGDLRDGPYEHALELGCSGARRAAPHSRRSRRTA